MLKDKYLFDIAVIGGGPAGMMAAGRAAELGAKVILIEKNNTLGKKLLITGKGRCNFTHNEYDIRKFAGKFGRNGRFLYGALSKFGVPEVIDFFESWGVKGKVERGDRIFPEKGNTQDILNVLLTYLSKEKVNILYNTEVKSFGQDKEKTFRIELYDSEIMACKIILCTGGKSYPQTGSTGDGYHLAESVGHTIVPVRPALVPLETTGNIAALLQGLSLRNITATLRINGRKTGRSLQGEMFFTHSGLSGPIILALSRQVVDAIRAGSEVVISIDLKPALDNRKLDARLQRDFLTYGRRKFKTILEGLLPQKLIPICTKLTKIDENKIGNQISYEERKRLRLWLKDFQFKISGYRPISEAIITAGGIDTREVDPRTMMSRLIRGLYFAGEILDVDADTGGYNLQAAFSTGWLAGKSAATGYYK